MTKTTEIWKLAQRLEPELWARLADGSIPEHVVNNIISDRLAKAEIYTEPRVVSLHPDLCSKRTNTRPIVIAMYSHGSLLSNKRLYRNTKRTA